MLPPAGNGTLGAMMVAVAGATGTVGAPVVRALLTQGMQVRVVVRDPGKARCLLGDAGPGLEIVAAPFDDGEAMRRAFEKVEAAFTALGASGEQGRLQLRLIDAAADAKVPFYVRLSVLGTGPDSLGFNQRAHAVIEAHQAARGVPGTQLRPSIFSTSLLGVAQSVRSTGGWPGCAPDGRQAFIDPADVVAVAAVVLGRPRGWPGVLQLTGPGLYSYPEVAALLSAETGRTISYRVLDEASFRADASRRGEPGAHIELLIGRDRAIQAGELERLTTTVRDVAGREARSLRAVLHEHRDAFITDAPAVPAMPPARSQKAAG